MLFRSAGLGAGAAARLTPGSTFTVPFPEMPPTYWAMATSNKGPAFLSVSLPKNYTPGGKFPLLVFLHGGSGGNGGAASSGPPMTKSLPVMVAPIRTAPSI